MASFINTITPEEPQVQLFISEALWVFYYLMWGTGLPSPYRTASVALSERGLTCWCVSFASLWLANRTLSRASDARMSLLQVASSRDDQLKGTGKIDQHQHPRVPAHMRIR